MSEHPRPPQASSGVDPTRRWWLALIWTIGAAVTLNLFFAYLVSRWLWPDVVFTLGTGLVVGLAALGLVLLALAVVGWAAYLRSRRQARPG